MGGKKKQKKKQVRVVAVVKQPTIFDCPFCNNKDCIEIKL